MNPKILGIQIGYSFGFTCLAGAAVYFYASNWGLLERWEKFAPLYAFVAGLFALGLWLLNRPGRALLGRLGLLGSCISFGIALAVIGQTYHSHADNYLLFAVWTVPALLYAVLTRWQPFGLLAFALGNTAYLMYFMDVVSPRSEAGQIGVSAGLALIQALLLLAVELKLLHAPAIRIAASAVLFADLLWLSNSLYFERYGLLLNLPLLGWLIWNGWSAWRNRSRTGLLLTGLGVSAASVLKYIEIAVRNWSDSFFVYSLLFVVLFVAGNAVWIKKLHTVIPGEVEEAESAEKAETAEEAEIRETPVNRLSFGRMLPKVLTYTVITIGTALGSLSLAGFLIVILEPDHPEYALMILGFLLYTAASLASVRRQGLVRHTLMGVGFSVGVAGSGVAEYPWMLLVFAGLAVYGYIRSAGIAGRTVHFASFAVTAWLMFLIWTDSGVTALSLLAALMILLFGTSGYVRQGQIRVQLRYSTVCGTLLALFLLTFISRGNWNLAHNGIFVAATLLCLTVSIRRRITGLTRFSFILWMLYVAWKYYDTVWKLLHKSLSLAVIGLAVMLAVWLVERRGRQERTETPKRAISAKGVGLSVLLVVLQLALMSVQIADSERLLAGGRTVKLALLPIDPRSLLQGDYVDLRYKISEAPPEGQPVRQGKKVSVVLAPDPSGVYGWSRIYRPGEALGPEEVVIRGRYRYDGVRYGIENYFVPEGTGQDVERTAKYALVRVAADGDAILVRLLPE